MNDKIDQILFQKLQYLKDQAEVIKLFGNNSKQIWKNVIVIAKQGSRHSHKANFQVKREQREREREREREGEREIERKIL